MKVLITTKFVFCVHVCWIMYVLAVKCEITQSGLELATKAETEYMVIYENCVQICSSPKSEEE
jgi:hypothetical protein